MDTRTEGKAEGLFKEIGRKIDDLIVDLKVAKDQVKVDYASQIEELKRNAETLKDEFSNFKENHKDQWEEAEASLERAGQELKNAFDVIFRNKEKKD